MLRRLLAVGISAALSWGWVAAWGQSYPARTVRIVVGFTPGGPGDLIARGTAQLLGQVFSQPFIIDNRVGATGIIAGEACAKAAPDGYTLCVSDSPAITLNPVMRAKMTYDPLRDLSPIVHYGYLPAALIVHPSMPVKSLQELFDLARAQPGSIKWSSYGQGSVSNLHIEWLRNAKGLNFLNVPYKSAPQSFQALLAGEVQVATFSVGQAAAAVRAGKIRALMVTLGKRSSHLPEVPTYKEAGMEISILLWFGLFAPTGTPKDIVQRLNAEVANGLINHPQMRAKFLTPQGIEIDTPAGESADAFAAAMTAERERLAAIVKTAGIKIE
jgi:tripartite-type tricarboxylate transporter receptor subunit TctC